MNVRVDAYPGKLSGGSFAVMPKPKSRKLVIFFSGTGKSDGKFDFWQVGRRIEENLLFVNNGRNEWYQRGVPGLGNSIEETAEKMKQWAEALRAEEVFMIGASMGGYGAALFGSLIGAKVMAFGIDTILKLPTSRSGKQMPKDLAVVHPDLVPIIRQHNTPIRLYVGEMDPMDIVGAARLTDLPSVQIETVRGVDHKCARFFLDNIGLYETMTAFIEGKQGPEIRERGNVVKHPQLVAAIHAAHLASTAGKWAEAVKEAKTAIEIDPYSEIAHFMLGKALIKLKKYGQAVRHLSFVAANVPDFEDGQFFYSHALRFDGHPDRAMHLLYKHVRRWPDSARAWYNIAKIYEDRGDRAGALSAMESAVGIEPNDPVYREKLEEMRNVL